MPKYKETKEQKLLEEEVIDYKNTRLLWSFTDRYGKIRPRYYTGISLKQQKEIMKAVKRARIMALIPFTK